MQIHQWTGEKLVLSIKMCFVRRINGCYRSITFILCIYISSIIISHVLSYRENKCIRNITKAMNENIAILKDIVKAHQTVKLIKCNNQKAQLPVWLIVCIQSTLNPPSRNHQRFPHAQKRSFSLATTCCLLAEDCGNRG